MRHELTLARMGALAALWMCGCVALPSDILASLDGGPVVEVYAGRVEDGPAAEPTYERSPYDCAPQGGAQSEAAGGTGAGHGDDDAGVPPGAPGDKPALPGPARPGVLVITEFMSDPATLSDTVGEWLEIHNPGEATYDLGGCSVDHGARQQPLMGSLPIGPGEYITVARSEEPGFPPDRVASISLSNGADSLALVCGGVEIDRVSYDASAGFGLVPGASLSLDPAATDAQQNDAGGAWCAASESYGTDRGTPGRANPPCVLEP